MRAFACQAEESSQPTLVWCLKREASCVFGGSPSWPAFPYMLVMSFCGSGTRFRFGSQSVHIRRDRLYVKDPDAHAVLRRSKCTQPTPLAQPMCKAYLNAHLRPWVAARLARESVALSAGDMAVRPLGRGWHNARRLHAKCFKVAIKDSLTILKNLFSTSCLSELGSWSGYLLQLFTTFFWTSIWRVQIVLVQISTWRSAPSLIAATWLWILWPVLFTKLGLSYRG